MKNKRIKLVLLLFACSIIFLATTACANEETETLNGTESTNDMKKIETTQQPSDTTEPPDEAKPILADLNHDGTDDKIVITYDDEQKVLQPLRLLTAKTIRS